MESLVAAAPVVGLIPAGGQATRIMPIPCSKELFPIGFFQYGVDGELRPKTACHYVLEKMRWAGIETAYIVVRKEKWDIPSYLGNGSLLDMHLGYLVVEKTPNVPYTLDQAYPFVRGARVALGFGDILFDSQDAFVHILKRQAATTADVVLGLFPSDKPEKVDMVEVDESGRVKSITIKPRHTNLHYTWGLAVWTPTFSEFLHAAAGDSRAASAGKPEMFVGDVIQAAINKGLHVDSVHVSDRPFIDIGTVEDLARAVRVFGHHEV
jgi:glucose-1-phosphate thymidylyltransferase